MAYLFQSFIFKQLYTSAAANQTELNVRDHVHGTASVVAVPDSGLSSNVGLLTGTQIFSGAKSFSSRLLLTNTDNIDLVGVSGSLIAGGDGTGIHIALGPQELQAKASPTTTANLSIQTLGGGCRIGGGLSTGSASIPATVGDLTVGNDLIVTGTCSITGAATLTGSLRINSGLGVNVAPPATVGNMAISGIFTGGIVPLERMAFITTLTFTNIASGTSSTQVVTHNLGTDNVFVALMSNLSSGAHSVVSRRPDGLGSAYTVPGSAPVNDVAPPSSGQVNVKYQNSTGDTLTISVRIAIFQES